LKIIQITMLMLTFALMLSGAINSSFAQIPLYLDILEHSSRTIRIDGSTNNPINITIQELIQMPAIKVPAALFCYNTLVGAGVWEGPQLSLLLEIAELENDTIALKFYADDGYTTHLSIEKAMEEDVIIAYAIDDQPLPELRLVVPGENGAVWITLINHIEARSYVPVIVSTPSPSPSPTPSPSPSPTPSPSPSPTPSPSPSPTPSPSPSPTPSPSNSVESSDTNRFPLVWIVAAVGAATIVGAILIVYKKKGAK
jgi:hypothetical protein